MPLKQGSSPIVGEAATRTAEMLEKLPPSYAAAHAETG